MNAVWLVPDSEVNKARDLLLQDDLIARQSLTIQQAKTLDLPDNGSFILLQGTEKAVEMAKGILKGIGELMDDKKTLKVVRRVEEASDSAASGLGSIFG